jgi:hypothetical protein
MSNIIPFFYFDIVARIIPGVMTIAVVILAGPNYKSSMARLLLESKEWNGLFISLLVGSLAYMIGVLYEGFYNVPFINKFRRFAERRAWQAAAIRFDGANGTSYRTKDPGFRITAWEQLVLQAALDSERMNAVFAHCHRFQAEAKMSQHLILTALLLPLLAHFRGSPLGLVDLTFLLVPLFALSSYSRDERRWWQLISFREQLQHSEAARTAESR